MKTAALIVAAGRGTRAGPGAPKQWRPLAGRRVADWTVAAFAAHPAIDLILAVTHPDDAAEAATLGVETVDGGATRADSVRAGLEALEGRGITHVLIHDVARAGITATIISDVLAMLKTSPGAAPALPVTDALWRGTDGTVSGTEDRSALYRAQTPQGFHFDAILAAHRAHPGNAADDVEVARAAGLDVTIVPGNETNLKITAPEDFARMEKSLRGAMDIRLGNGFDVHAFDDGGDHVTLCGVQIPHTRGLKGHSDADVGMHAVTDAIYGALAMGDIGRHFPPSDMQWKGADSAIFLDHAVKLAAEHGFSISNIDCTLICERPKIGPHAAAMTNRMAEIMGLEAARISIKATTSEKLGFTGREEGIAALATATLVKA
ncbi:bifunctional 2-C-methyl-D-erythritol 4-phosphate cytidylyltransferase/2-C-methyl-D-erythritol 2,4-cyclodiphosphate synthase [Shimia sp. FJ5]|uniref:bifunctional 2-C-methyl-D-erythritol 4-phosphate cytidylyltransferase/2-C-methyl-D-erythritol 2,4-cyclodiphosphate synthase n=1 Tax=Shimia sp. FJ5 TaxID=3079054 RepID=UPI00260634D0|nr:bifunctional 2-C-methyl-D-erythritol 4-phosphate cytidylyltransferase/2-C-methyl-D-erythritol 2,4-cyclodiphosphate synthase [Shimia sp. FJ5]MDV4144138.1 bifunctional 2-C-methyl-D-erythritol 4-phosphate cytidylyltransferase/2-C-methyl-D-erythritol 2,4-cyclodiphosphate synthase [Shimia sp. FJ5]